MVISSYELQYVWWFSREVERGRGVHCRNPNLKDTLIPARGFGYEEDDIAGLLALESWIVEMCRCDVKFRQTRLAGAARERGTSARAWFSWWCTSLCIFSLEIFEHFSGLIVSLN